MWLLNILFLDRPQLSRDCVRENSKNIVKQLAEILEHGRDMFEDRIRLTILNNIDWYENVSIYLCIYSLLLLCLEKHD